MIHLKRPWILNPRMKVVGGLAHTWAFEVWDAPEGQPELRRSPRLSAGKVPPGDRRLHLVALRENEEQEGERAA